MSAVAKVTERGLRLRQGTLAGSRSMTERKPRAMAYGKDQPQSSNTILCLLSVESPEDESQDERTAFKA